MVQFFQCFFQFFQFLQTASKGLNSGFEFRSGSLLGLCSLSFYVEKQSKLACSKLHDTARKQIQLCKLAFLQSLQWLQSRCVLGCHFKLQLIRSYLSEQGVSMYVCVRGCLNKIPCTMRYICTRGNGEILQTSCFSCFLNFLSLGHATEMFL